MPNNKFSQISLLDIYEDVNTSFTEKKSELVSLLEKHIDFSSLISYEFDEYGTPLCPLDKTPFIFLGKSGGKNRSQRFKWVCHKSVQSGSTRICTCQNPCTESPYGKCTYTYPDRDFRMYPGVPRNTEHWDNLYNHRVYIERTIFLLKWSGII